MDNETLEMLETSLTHLLEQEDDRPLMERLVEFGWDEVIADDRVACFTLLFELKGRLRSNDDVLNTTLTAALADALEDPSLANAVIVLASSLAASDLATGLAATLDGDEWRVEGITLARAEGRPLVFPVKGGLAVVKNASCLVRSALDGFEDALPQERIKGAIPAGEVVVHSSESTLEAWTGVVGLARWLLAAELLGIGHHVIQDVVNYTTARKQYGVSIASFQAIQHRMASAHSALVGAGRVAAQAGHTGAAWDTLVAKAAAGRAAEEACVQAQQGYGAIGFTWEQEFHRYLKRTYALDRLFGEFRNLEFEIGATLQRTREVPRIGGF
jgi:alkylation response protein AidB-like acyl-CoA dehydrogenase